MSRFALRSTVPQPAHTRALSRHSQPWESYRSLHAMQKGYPPMTIEQRYLLTVFHQAGRDDRIVKGADGRRDFVTADELEKACWSMMQSGVPEVGIFHIDGTVGHAQVVESYIYRGPDWPVTADDGTEVVIKSGDWLGGLLLDDAAWNLKKAGRVSGVSIQGQGRRRSRANRSTP